MARSHLPALFGENAEEKKNDEEKNRTDRLKDINDDLEKRQQRAREDAERRRADARKDHSRAMRQYAPTTNSKNELFDCDDYAFTFKSSVSYYGLMMGNNYLCGVLIVKQAKAFGGVPAVGYHALNVILLDGVLYVLEPQTYKLTPLSEYPNRDNIINLII